MGVSPAEYWCMTILEMFPLGGLSWPRLTEDGAGAGKGQTLGQGDPG